MKRSLIMASAAALLLSLAVLGGGGAKNKALGAQQFKGSVTINTAPAKVWAVLTNAHKIGVALGYEHTGGGMDLEKVGGSARFKVWGDEGTIVTTRADPNKELRLAWDPDNGSYICQEWFKLKDAGGKTELTYKNRYTESGPQTKESIAKQVKGIDKILAKVKAEAEK